MPWWDICQPALSLTRNKRLPGESSVTSPLPVVCSRSPGLATQPTCGISAVASSKNNAAPGAVLLTIAVFGSAHFTDHLAVFDDQRQQVSAGFFDLDVGPATILATVDAAFASYNLKTTIGPIYGRPVHRSIFVPHGSRVAKFWRQ